MAIIALSASSTSLILNGFAVTDFSTDGDYLQLNAINPLTSHVNAANGGVNINARADSGVFDLVFRVQKFSGSDVFLNSQLNQQTPVVFNGSVKEDFERDGVAGAESYILENGSFTTLPSNIKNSTDGNGVMEYTIRFRSVTRNI